MLPPTPSARATTTATEVEATVVVDRRRPAPSAVNGSRCDGAAGAAPSACGRRWSRRASCTPATPSTHAAISDDRSGDRDDRAARAAARRCRTRRHASIVLAVQPARRDHVEHGVGDQVVERPAVAEPRPQIGARHLEAGHLDADPVDRRGQLAPARPGGRRRRAVTGRPPRRARSQVRDAGRGVVADDREQLGARDTRPPARPACRRCSSAAVVDLVVDRPPGRRRRRPPPRPSPGGRRPAVIARLPTLLPGHVGDHQDDEVELEGVAHVDGGDQMADVRRVERAPEQPDTQGLERQDRRGTSGQSYGRATGRIRIGTTIGTVLDRFVTVESRS